MAYRFATERVDYSAFAGGQVLYSLPGQTAFPVRLASELFQRCHARLDAAGVSAPYVVYDPCCGGAHLLTALAFLHGEAIRTIVGSDVDEEAVHLAERNLSLLTPSGLEARIASRAALLERFGKDAHAAAVQHAVALRGRLEALRRHHPIETFVFRADATQPDALRRHFPAPAAELVIADVPYGRRAAWHGEARQGPEESPDGEPVSPSPVWRLLEALRPVVAQQGIVAIAANKGQRVHHERYRRVEQVRAGKRRVTILAVAP